MEALNAGTGLQVRSLASTSFISIDYSASMASDGSAAARLWSRWINTTGQPTQQKQTTGAGGGAVQQNIVLGGLIAKQVESRYAMAGEERAVDN